MGQHDRRPWFVRWRSHAGIRWGLYGTFLGLLGLLLWGHVGSVRYTMRVGMISPITFVAPFTTIDTGATEAARTGAMRAVEDQYTRYDHRTDLQIQRVDRLFARLHAYAEAYENALGSPAHLRMVGAALDSFVNDVMVHGTVPPRVSGGDLIQMLAHLLPERLMELRFEVRRIVERLLSHGIRPTELHRYQEQVPEIVDENADLDSKDKRTVTELVRKVLVSNEAYNAELTERQRRSARDAVTPIPILRGQVIVAEGQIVTPDQLRKLEKFHFLSSPWRSAVMDMGLLVLVGIWVALLAGYIHLFARYVARDNRKLLLLLLMLLITVALTKALAMIGRATGFPLLGFAAPISFAALTIALLLDARLSLVSVSLLAVAVGVFFSYEADFRFSLQIGFASLCSGVVGACMLVRTKQRYRHRLLRAGLAAAVAGWPPILVGYLLAPWEARNLVELGKAGLLSSGGALASVFLVLGLLPYLETLFAVLSPIRLLELCNPNQPLLRRLLLRAPGTYHHSLMVANLAEVAAEAIGADGLLARTGAYYHDVGKTKRSRFFVENQLPGTDNPHNLLSPFLSRSIIHAHVWEGVKILRQHRLPPPIRDIVAQHHGTTLLRFFYYKALRQARPCEFVVEHSFRYPGPLAQTKEAAIVGIADCVEAATRSLTFHPVPARLESLVRRIVHDRLIDGQFAACDLTFCELEKIIQAIVAFLQGIFHTRVAYPRIPRSNQGWQKG